MARRSSRPSRSQEPQFPPDAVEADVCPTPVPDGTSDGAPEGAPEGAPVAEAGAGLDVATQSTTAPEPSGGNVGEVSEVVAAVGEAGSGVGAGAVVAGGEAPADALREVEEGGGVEPAVSVEGGETVVAGGGEGPLELKWIVESLLFAAQKPMTPKELRELLVLASQDGEAPEALAFRKVRDPEILSALEVLQADHEAAGRTYRLQCVGGGWQFASVPRYAPWLRALLGRKARPPRLSQPGIETLTIVAYRQPVTRAEIEQIRGVSVDGVMQTLLERGLVVAVGRAEVIGRPVTYGTTPLFLEYFGLRALDDLPSADELRRLPVLKPEALSTVDPGLATAPADAPPPVVDLAAAEAPAPGVPVAEAGPMEAPAAEPAPAPAEGGSGGGG